jgi:hypothetical protein
MAIAALVLGIIAIALGSWSVVPMLGLVAAFFAFAPAVLALILGIVGMSKAKAVGVGRGQALAGVVLGSVTVGIMVLTTFAWFVLGSISG